MKTPFIFLSLAFALLTSCGSVSGVAGLNKNDLRNFKLSDLRGNKVPVVAVKKGSLKELKSGQEQYLAWNLSMKNSRFASADGAFFAPENFDPANLPASTGLPSFGLLPPLNPGASSGVDVSSGLEGLAEEKAADTTANETD